MSDDTLPHDQSFAPNESTHRSTQDTRDIMDVPDLRGYLLPLSLITKRRGISNDTQGLLRKLRHLPVSKVRF